MTASHLIPFSLSFFFLFHFLPVSLTLYYLFSFSPMKIHLIIECMNKNYQDVKRMTGMNRIENKDTGYSSSSSSSNGISKLSSLNCQNCKVLCNELNQTAVGSFCSSCFQHWRWIFLCSLWIYFLLCFFFFDLPGDCGVIFFRLAHLISFFKKCLKNSTLFSSHH